MTPSELRFHIEQADPGTHFFDRDAMRFFGDTMSNFGVRSADVVVNGVTVECWELYRRHPVKHGLKTSHFFSKTTYRKVYPS